jgi:putative transposase
MSRNQPPRLDRIFQRYDPSLFFVTCCTAGRRRILANTRGYIAFVDYANRGVDRHVAVGRYVIMPDHIHLFVAGGADFDLGMWVRGLKRFVAAAATGGRADQDSAAQTAAATTRRPISSASGSSLAAGVWQRGFFDHLIRNSESYHQKWEYIRENLG